LRNFAWDRATLTQLSAHVETGEALPDDLFAKMLAAPIEGRSTSVSRWCSTWPNSCSSVTTSPCASRAGVSPMT
jgi:hypothetical protein